MNDIYNKLKNTKGGKNVSYIPELTKVDPTLYGISIYTVDGNKYNIGDTDVEFAIESCSKVFTLALALEKYGIDTLKKKIGELKSSYDHQSIVAVDKYPNHTINSFDNGGAIATTSLLYENDKKRSERNIIENMSKFAGTKLHANQKIYKSEISSSSHNLAIAYLLDSYDRFYAPVEESVDIYTKQCSVMVTCENLAVMAATLANKGINPKTKKRVMHNKNIPYILNHMCIDGLYSGTDAWMKDIGLPAKSGVSGLIMIVVPGVMGIAIVSPPLDKNGNSYKGIKTAKLLVKAI
jgi:glutaminase